MADKMKELENNIQNMGTVKISEEVLAAIAALATDSVEGVEEIIGAKSSSFMGSSKKNLGKGIKISLEDNQALVDLSISVRYGEVLVDVAKKVQDSVRHSIENMTDIPVKEVNVSISDIAFADKKEEKKPKKVVEDKK